MTRKLLRLAFDQTNYHLFNKTRRWCLSVKTREGRWPQEFLVGARTLVLDIINNKSGFLIIKIVFSTAIIFLYLITIFFPLNL